MEHIRVVVADDHPVMRSGIRALLERAPDVSVVGEAATGVEALRMARDLAPDVLLLDLEMPEMRGDEVARRIQQDGLAVRVLVLSAYDDESHILALLERGAAGYLTKAEAPGGIVDAVRGVARGERGWFSHGVAATVAQARTTPRPDVPGTLSPRERQVLVLLARGYDNPCIAGALGIGEGTVKNHVTNIYDKIGVHTRAEAVAWAWGQGIADKGELAARERAETDAAFATMGDDPEHQDEVRSLDEEFVQAGWEALRRAEQAEDAS